MEKSPLSTKRCEISEPIDVDATSYEGKGRLVHRAVLVNIIVDSLGICKVPALSMIGTFDLEPEALLTSALTEVNDTLTFSLCRSVASRCLSRSSITDICEAKDLSFS